MGIVSKRPKTRVLIATVLFGIGVVSEGFWIFAALVVGGNKGGWLNAVISAWGLMAFSGVFFWRFPSASVVTALVNLVLCVRTFYADGQNFHDPKGLAYRHSVDLLILGASLLGLRGRPDQFNQSL